MSPNNVKTTRQHFQYTHLPCVHVTPAVLHGQTNGVRGCCMSWSYDPGDRIYSAPLQRSVQTHKSTEQLFQMSLVIHLSPVSFSSINNDRILTHNGSHLRVLAKEPVFVTALHSQQSVFMLLFQLNDLLFQRRVHPGGVHILWPPRLGDRVWQKIWFIIMCILFSRFEALKKNLNKVQTIFLCVTEQFTFEPSCCKSKLRKVAARLSTFLESVSPDLPSSSSLSSSSSRSLSSSKCCCVSSQGFWSHTLFWALSNVFTSLSVSRWPTLVSDVQQVKAFSLSKVEEQRLPAPGFSVEVVAEDIKHIFSSMDFHNTWQESRTDRWTDKRTPSFL